MIVTPQTGPSPAAYIHAQSERLPVGTDGREASIDLSVVIPAHNSDDTIGVLLDSIVRNNIAVGHEVIVVLDRCTDNTEEVCRRYAFVRAVRSEVAGAGPSRHLGALQSRGNTLLFLDADTVLDDHVINAMYAYWRSRAGAAAVIGEYHKKPVNDHFASRFLALKWHFTVLSAIEHSDDMCDFGGGPAMIGREKYFQSGGFDDNRYRSSGGEEFEAALRIRRVCPIHYRPEFNVGHHFRSVFSVFPLLIKRSYNFTMILMSLPREERLALNWTADATERLKLFLVWIFYSTAALSIALPWCNQFLLLVLLLVYCVVDGKFIAFMTAEQGALFAVAAIFQDWVLYTAKGLGVMAAAISRWALNNRGHRF